MNSSEARKAADASAQNAAQRASRQALESALGMSDAILAAWTSITEEWIALTRAQLQGHQSFVRSLADCRDPMAAVALQLDGAQESLARYVNAATKASNTMQTLTSQAWASARSNTAAAA